MIKRYFQLKLFLSSVLLVIIFLFIGCSTTKAFGITQQNKIINAMGGETIEHTIGLFDLDPSIANTYTLKFLDYSLNKEGGKVFLPLNEYSPDGMASWIEDKKQVVEIPASIEKQQYSLKLHVPENIGSGAYKLAIILSPTTSNSETENTNFGIEAQVVAFLYLNVTGEDTNAKLEINSFSFSDNAFFINVKNTGNVALIPFGQIYIYDKNGNLVKNVAQIAKGEGTKNLDYLPINQGGTIIFPDEEKKLQITQNPLKLAKGNYVAKATIYYKDISSNETKESTAKTEFVIEKNIKIENFESDKFWHQSPPVVFKGSIKNDGEFSLEYGAKINVYDLFGKNIKTIDLDKKLLKSKEENEIKQEFNFDNLFGLYTAKLILVYGNNNTLETSTTFLVLTWWQALLAFVILLVIIFGIYKGVSGYRKLKKKVEKLEHEEKK
jgi:hypothetical protein